jgi:hypothetical protein
MPFQLEVYRTMWGVPDPMNKLEAVKKDNMFVGIEQGLIQLTEDNKRIFRQKVKDLGFKFLAMIFTEGNTVEEHIESFRQQVYEAKVDNPVFYNSHSGKDSWSFQESEKYFEAVLQIEKEVGIPICHETHRGRILYNPWITRDLLKRFPDLKLCADLSHWVVVCERLIDTELDILKLVAERTIHIHARVGYEQGPQINDPRSAENLSYVEAHERWWDLIWDYQSKNNIAVTTLNAEFGPPPYMHVQPFTNQPVTDLWEVTNWQAKRQIDRFQKKYQQ